MPRTHIAQISISIPRDKLAALNAQAAKTPHKTTAAWARALLANASGLKLDVQHGGKRAGAGRKPEADGPVE